MAFHDVLFPTDISYGSAGGPGFMTNIVETDSGAEHRVSRWNQARRRYNVAYGVQSHKQLYELQEFYIARRGPAASFRFKDFMDCTSADGPDPSLAGSAITALDQVIGTGNGVATIFQLTKRYSPGLFQRLRNITKIDDAVTPLVAVDGITMGNWTINPNNGLLSFSAPPPEGQVVTAGFFFHVPVRFGKEVDSVLQLDIENFGSGSALDVPLVEDIEPGELSDEFFYGGAKKFTFSTSITFSALDGRVIELNPTVSGLTASLPSKASLVAGAPWFYIINSNLTNSVSVVDINSGLPIVELDPQTSVTMVLAEDGATRTWYAA